MINKKRLDFIVNPISGGKSKDKIIDRLQQGLGSAFETHIHLSESREHITELAAGSIKRGTDALIAVGGDGSINQIGKSLLHQKIPLGIIPAGSGNGFARHFNVPLTTEAALDRLKAWEPFEIDTGIANDEAFFATLGIGFDALVSKKFANSKQRGLQTYAKTSLNSFINYKANDYTLIVDGKHLQKEAFLIAIANVGQYGNNAWISPKASAKDGLLNICILHPFPKWLVGNITYQLFNKKIDQSTYYEDFKASKIKIQHSGIYHLDGEPHECKKELLIQSVPNSLLLL